MAAINEIIILLIRGILSFLSHVVDRRNCSYPNSSNPRVIWRGRNTARTNLDNTDSFRMTFQHTVAKYSYTNNVIAAGPSILDDTSC